MKVTISVYGRYHAFDLAREMERAGCLDTLITSQPKFAATRFGISRARVTSLLTAEVMRRGWHWLPDLVRSPFDEASNYLFSEYFDRLAATSVRPCDLFVGFSTFSLRTMKEARAQGAVTVLERGSSHRLYQQELVAEEYARFGATHRLLADPRLVDKELAEYEAADFISVPSHFAKQSFIERGVPAHKLLQVPYGVDPEHFHATAPHDEVFRLIHVGGLTLRKGVHYLLRAFHELRLPGAELWLVGQAAPEITPFLRQYGGSAVRMIASQPQNQLHRYYSQATAFCLNSIEEGFGMVVSQAMACGLPIVCTEHTGARDLIRHGVDGLVIPVRDVEKLKESILFLYGDRVAARAMGESARQRVLAEFTWRDYRHRMLAAYRGALAAVPHVPLH